MTMNVTTSSSMKIIYAQVDLGNFIDGGRRCKSVIGPFQWAMIIMGRIDATTAMMVPSVFLVVQLDYVTSVVVSFYQFKLVKIRFKFREPDYSNLMVLHRDWAHSTSYVNGCVPHDPLVMGRSGITGIPHLGSVTDYNRAFSVDDDAPSNPLVKLVLGNPSWYVDAPSLYDLIMGRPTAGIPDLGLPVKASACWKRTKLKRYESVTMLVVTTSEDVHRGDRASCTAEWYKVAQLVDPQDLDRGVDPDDDHGLTHHRSVMVHVDPPPPPAPPPRIHHPPNGRINLVNQDPSLKFIKIEILLVAWYISLWLVSVKTATVVTVDFYTVDLYPIYCDTSFVSGFPCCDRLVDLRLSPVQYLGIPSHGESYVSCDDEFVVNDSFQPLPTTITDDYCDVHALRRVRGAIATASSGRCRFSNIAGNNIPATILRDHWSYLPGRQHMFKVLRHVDGETIKSPVEIHEDNDIETQ
jgi:hypothetical protein